MKMISSRENRLVKETVELHEARGRKRLQRFMVEGLRSCETFLNSKRFELVHVIVTAANEEWAQGLGIEDDKIIGVFDTVMKKII